MGERGAVGAVGSAARASGAAAVAGCGGDGSGRGDGAARWGAAPGVHGVPGDQPRPGHGADPVRSGAVGGARPDRLQRDAHRVAARSRPARRGRHRRSGCAVTGRVAYGLDEARAELAAITTRAQELREFIEEEAQRRRRAAYALNRYEPCDWCGSTRHT